MVLDNDWLASVLEGLAFVVHRTPHVGECVIDVHLGDHDAQLKVILTEDFPAALPKFHLLERYKYGALAHVSWGKSGGSEVCFGSSSAFNVDYEHPERIVEVALEHALDVLSKSLNDKAYNDSELKREFVSVWTRSIDAQIPLLFCMAEPTQDFEVLEIRSDSAKADFGVGKAYIAYTKENAINHSHRWVHEVASKGRSDRGKGILVSIPMLIAPPGPGEAVYDWWLELLRLQPDDLLIALKNHARHTRAKQYFIVCRSTIETGAVWYALYGQSARKDRAPLHPDYVAGWELHAIRLDVAASENLLPRGGADLKLRDAKVCLVGCGSVGGYIADLLASSGIGCIDLVDDDSLMIENTHRHYLRSDYLYCNKAQALGHALQKKYPFVTCNLVEGRLQRVMAEMSSGDYDLIICATGDQSQERYPKSIFASRGCRCAMCICLG